MNGTLFPSTVLSNSEIKTSTDKTLFLHLKKKQEKKQELSTRSVNNHKARFFTIELFGENNNE